ncbi:hypothetical protein ADUPG1_013225 [Aduncisulcus paluster]|uniref:UEV domain-containing protein n=1 Tax=Aduncisulcus paluster TaxID=2918883 RepID=A0ABQ5K260_9EUKA|nr:hypothetical protein ADUPG1_013225 [Aduncisulcus paluster]|eukprot:gnl/Carplike_NY0171/985_a1353_1479.p1 GENE.gnl/Carplike_NY0171/985_a1353_1479~~gnl/Carplike_NY0171/985_a1353_1479.p1  ORF type:complete len:505 (-),score=107.63 gnl/Carplike_NY0171/985_a1353_1479:201-1715(-)
MASLPSQTAIKQLKALLPSLPYLNRAVVESHIMAGLSAVPSLSTVQKFSLTRPGTSKVDSILCLYGMIPAVFRGTTYRFPIRIIFDYDYPLSPPISYLVPVTGLFLRPTTEVNVSGYVNIPIVNQWRTSRTTPAGHSLVTVLHSMSQKFSINPPFSSKSSFGTPMAERQALQNFLQTEMSYPFIQRVGYYAKPVYLERSQQITDPDPPVPTAPIDDKPTPIPDPPTPTPQGPSIFELRYILANKLAQDMAKIKLQLMTATKHVMEKGSSVQGIAGHIDKSMTSLDRKKTEMLSAIDAAKQEKLDKEKEELERSSMLGTSPSPPSSPQEQLLKSLNETITTIVEPEDHNSLYLIRNSSTVHACNDTMTVLKAAMANRLLLLDEVDADDEHREKCISSGLLLVQKLSNTLFECGKEAKYLVSERIKTKGTTAPMSGDTISPMPLDVPIGTPGVPVSMPSLQPITNPLPISSGGHHPISTPVDPRRYNPKPSPQIDFSWGNSSLLRK